jgi:RNA ligase (TIGR02306 family)
MSTFAVELKKIAKIYPHPNADKLELGQVEGMTYQFVVQKGLYNPGNEVIFFPIDSLLPQELIQQQGIANFMAGKDKNRVKTCRLRGEISQGYVAPANSIKQYLKVGTLPDNLTEALNVTKYEPPEIMTHSGNLVKLPEQVYYYDIEGCDRYPEIVEKLMEEKVFITEKLEGSNMATAIDIDKKIYVCQHGFAIENLPDREEHTFWQIARNEGLIDAVKLLQNDYYPDCTITIRSEALGSIQGNYYNLKKHTTKIFDLEINRKALDFNDLMIILEKIKLKDKFVPVLASDITLREWLNGRSLQLASGGKSALVDKIREGIVIKPMKEQYIIGFGRLFIKQRDPLYLDKTGN